MTDIGKYKQMKNLYKKYNVKRGLEWNIFGYQFNSPIKHRSSWEMSFGLKLNFINKGFDLFFTEWPWQGWRIELRYYELPFCSIKRFGIFYFYKKTGQHIKRFSFFKRYD